MQYPLEFENYVTCRRTVMKVAVAVELTTGRLSPVSVCQFTRR